MTWAARAARELEPAEDEPDSAVENLLESELESESDPESEGEFDGDRVTFEERCDRTDSLELCLCLRLTRGADFAAGDVAFATG